MLIKKIIKFIKKFLKKCVKTLDGIYYIVYNKGVIKVEHDFNGFE